VILSLHCALPHNTCPATSSCLAGGALCVCGGGGGRHVGARTHAPTLCLNLILILYATPPPHPTPTCPARLARLPWTWPWSSSSLQQPACWQRHWQAGGPAAAHQQVRGRDNIGSGNGLAEVFLLGDRDVQCAMLHPLTPFLLSVSV
jgi:hypothetical protein